MVSDYDVDLYVIGSNSRMMSSEIATYLTGRYVSFRIFPLSFEEYLTSKYALRTDEFAGGNYEGIKSMHVADFLLSKEY